ncbi:aminotransferase [Mrakia frigida]|uniref:aminotransferase n=1 Tax=Mrakia frigida TaxID=29902 RepID=UPI003FCC23B3
MARMNSSAERIGLPQFNHDALVSLLKTLVKIDEAFIPPPPGTLYIRPTMIGTRPTLGMGVDESCTLFVFLSPVGSYFNFGNTGLSILATKDSVRAWPGGTGCYKLAGNYAPTFKPQQKAKELGYDQNLWCLGDVVTKNGGSNFMIVVESKEGVSQLITAPLNGEILPGVTRDSLLLLTRGHIAGELVVDGIPTSNFAVQERQFTLQDLKRWSDKGRLKEAFGCGTAVLISPIGRIGIPTDSGEIEDIIIPNYAETGFGLIAAALLARISGIQWGTIAEPKGWSVVC